MLTKGLFVALCLCPGTVIGTPISFDLQEDEHEASEGKTHSLRGGKMVRGLSELDVVRSEPDVLLSEPDEVPLEETSVEDMPHGYTSYGFQEPPVAPMSDPSDVGPHTCRHCIPSLANTAHRVMETSKRVTLCLAIHIPPHSTTLSWEILHLEGFHVLTLDASTSVKGMVYPRLVPAPVIAQRKVVRPSVVMGRHRMAHRRKVIRPSVVMAHPRMAHQRKVVVMARPRMARRRKAIRPLVVMGRPRMAHRRKAIQGMARFHRTARPHMAGQRKAIRPLVVMARPHMAHRRKAIPGTARFHRRTAPRRRAIPVTIHPDMAPRRRAIPDMIRSHLLGMAPFHPPDTAYLKRKALPVITVITRTLPRPATLPRTVRPMVRGKKEQCRRKLWNHEARKMKV